MTRLMRSMIDREMTPDRQGAILAALISVTSLHGVLVGELSRARVEERLGQLAREALRGDFRDIAIAVDSAMAMITYGPTRR